MTTQRDIEVNTVKRTARQKTHSQKAHATKKRLSTGEGPLKSCLSGIAGSKCFHTICVHNINW